ncbi:MAG: hypothetical protein OXC05_05685 [Halieaceae bacterium]|nr:hypothetical protein [Halieaceae bacterium]
MPSSARRRAQAAPLETSETIADQIAAFIKAGGKVQEIPRGVSGQLSSTARKHITISNKS